MASPVVSLTCTIVAILRVQDQVEGAKGFVWAATLPDEGPSGEFFRDSKTLGW